MLWLTVGCIVAKILFPIEKYQVVNNHENFKFHMVSAFLQEFSDHFLIIYLFSHNKSKFIKACQKEITDSKPKFIQQIVCVLILFHKKCFHMKQLAIHSREIKRQLLPLSISVRNFLKFTIHLDHRICFVNEKPLAFKRLKNVIFKTLLHISAAGML